MSGSGQGTASRFRWDGESFAAVPLPVDGPGADASDASDAIDVIDVIDSWLVADGAWLASERHADRFAGAVHRLHGIDPAVSREFVIAARPLIPAGGAWFPRVEYSPAGGFHLLVRPAPARGSTVRLWTAPGPDARSRPSIKGFDLALLSGLREQAQAAGADEPLLLDDRGRIVEGASTSILWWRDGALCAPPESESVLSGVTRAVLFELAEASAIPVRQESARPRDLDGLEVWAVNALHGIRPVVPWPGSPMQPGPARRAARWRRVLEERRGSCRG